MGLVESSRLGGVRWGEDGRGEDSELTGGGCMRWFGFLR